jgi:hypothetical protein
MHQLKLTPSQPEITITNLGACSPAILAEQKHLLSDRRRCRGVKLKQLIDRMAAHYKINPDRISYQNMTVDRKIRPHYRGREVVHTGFNIDGKKEGHAYVYAGSLGVCIKSSSTMVFSGVFQNDKKNGPGMEWH